MGTLSEEFAPGGGFVWVVNQFSHNVTKLNGSTGALLGVYAVGDARAHAILVGDNVWVANFGSRNVTRLRASDGVQLSIHKTTLQ